MYSWYYCCKIQNFFAQFNFKKAHVFWDYQIPCSTKSVTERSPTVPSLSNGVSFAQNEEHDVLTLTHSI